MMDEEQALKTIRTKGLTQYTANSVKDIDRYMEEIKSVRAQGFATDDEEYILGVRAVAAPIVGRTHLMSAIWAVGFKASLNEDKMKALAIFTREAAEAIRRKIDGQPLTST
jgi:DNA-binding IclR family transcriptional regulator